MDDDHNIRLIVGLGNPGEKYRETRHNAGFMVIDQFLESLKGDVAATKFGNSLVWEKRIRGRAVLMQKPLTFMNRSGEAVKPLMKRHQVMPNELLVIYDDLDLSLGRIRIRKQGSSGGHNGVQSIIDSIESDQFPRLRVGISPATPAANQVDFVLSHFTPEEKPLWSDVLTMTVASLKTILFRSVAQAMNDFNGRCAELEDN